MNSDQETLPNNEQILKAVLKMRTEINAKFEDMRLQLMSVDVRIDRIEALVDEVLNVAYTARADVKVLREEVRAWAKDVADLQLKAA